MTDLVNYPIHIPSFWIIFGQNQFRNGRFGTLVSIGWILTYNSHSTNLLHRVTLQKGVPLSRTDTHLFQNNAQLTSTTKQIMLYPSKNKPIFDFPQPKDM